MLTVFESLFNIVLVIVISIYMLLDADRLSRFLRRLFPGGSREEDLIERCERALVSYVRGQTTVSLVIGASAGLLMWILGVLGIFENGDDYALAFGAFAAVTEVIPYVGPWLGAIPPLLVALVQSPGAAIAVALAFLIIHQIEGHIVIPKLMGGAVGVHPLVVIFSLLAAAQLYGVAGVLVALPLVAVGREVALFLRERLTLESWAGHPIPVGVPVEVEPREPRPRSPRGRRPPPNRRKRTRRRTLRSRERAADPGLGRRRQRVLVGRRQVGRQLECLQGGLGAAHPLRGTCRTSGRPWPARASSRSGR